MRASVIFKAHLDESDYIVTSEDMVEGLTITNGGMYDSREEITLHDFAAVEELRDALNIYLNARQGLKSLT